MHKRRPGTLHLITVKAQTERQVVSRLRELGIAAYSPKYLQPVGAELVDQPLFPGYVFVWVVDQWAQVRNTVGVQDFLRNGDKQPAHVEPSIVDALRDRENGYGYVRLYAKFAIGQSVRVGDAIGLYAGMDRLSRVRVLFKLLGREVEMSIPAQDLVAA